MKLSLRGSYEFTLLGPDGVVKQHIIGPNLVVNAGLNLVLQLVGGIVATPAVYLALGSSTTAVVATDTSLGAEAASGVRKLATVTLTSTGVMQFSAVWGQSDNANTTVNEAGLFTALTGGTLFSHILTGNPITKGQFDQLQVAYTLQVVEG